MSDRSKKIFLALSIIVPFAIYCIYYYGIMVKNAPYKFSEFESVTFKYGIGDSLVNQYDSKTGNYQYLDQNDSLIKTHVKLRKDDLLYLHRKAADLGFWNFPKEITNSSNDGRRTSPRYYLEFKYQRKAKQILFDIDFNGDPKLKDAARILIEEVSRTINDAEDRSGRR
jgi:hypothetical protein